MIGVYGVQFLLVESCKIGGDLLIIMELSISFISITLKLFNNSKIPEEIGNFYATERNVRILNLSSILKTNRNPS